MNSLLRSLIRETLLLEEVYGAQAIVYHGTKADPQKLISALLNDEFRPGEGAGSMYGKGLYTVYDLSGTKTATGDYGVHVIKLKVNLYGYIIFDSDTAQKVYKRSLTPAEQAEEVGYSETVIDTLSGVKQQQDEKFTSDFAFSVYKKLQNEVRGLVFTGRNDGRVVVIYDPTTAVPMAWKKITRASSPWIPVDRAKLLEPLDRPDVSTRMGRPVQQSALRRSATGDFEAGKWDPLVALKRLEKLPENQRVVMGNLDLYEVPITSLPAGLKVSGDLVLVRSSITSLPTGLKVSGDLNLARCSITSLPSDLQVGGDLSLYGTPIASLPTELHVGGSLNLLATPIAYLPMRLKIGGDLYLSDSSVTSLPSDLQVDGHLSLYGTPVTTLPAGLKVGSVIYGLDRKYWSNVPEHLKGKLR